MAVQHKGVIRSCGCRVLALLKKTILELQLMSMPLALGRCKQGKSSTAHNYKAPEPLPSPSTNSAASHE